MSDKKAHFENCAEEIEKNLDGDVDIEIPLKMDGIFKAKTVDLAELTRFLVENLRGKEPTPDRILNFMEASVQRFKMCRLLEETEDYWEILFYTKVMPLNYDYILYLRKDWFEEDSTTPLPKVREVECPECGSKHIRSLTLEFPIHEYKCLECYEDFDKVFKGASGGGKDE